MYTNYHNSNELSTNLGHSKCNPWRTGADFARGGGIMTPLDKIGLSIRVLAKFKEEQKSIFFNKQEIVEHYLQNICLFRFHNQLG